MRKKILVTVAAIALLGGAGYFTGVGITSYYAEDGINQALDSFNTQLDNKYSQGFLPYRLNVEYQKKKSGFFKSRGNLYLRNISTLEEIILPVEIKNKFLAADAKINLDKIVKNLFVYTNILDADVKTQSKLKFRLWPRNIKASVSIEGDYDKKLIDSAPRYLSPYAKRKLKANLNIYQQNRNSIETSVDIHNLALPDLSAKRIYALNKVNFDDHFPQSAMTLGAEGLYVFNSNFANIDNFKVKFATSVPDYKDNFNLKYDVDVKTRHGVISTEGSLGPFPCAKFKDNSLDALSLNAIFANQKVTLKMDDLNLDINFNRIDKNISFLGKAYGSLHLPAKSTFFEALSGAYGSFDVTLKDVSPDAMSYTHFFEKRNDDYHALISIDAGIIKVNDQEIQF